MKITKILLGLLLLGSTSSMYARQIHVSKRGSDTNQGSFEQPYLTISKAAKVALAGDSVIVHEGTYREWVSPANSGFSPHKRIVYMAASGEKVYLKGSEVLTAWKAQKKNSWKAEVNNSLFGNFNPFATPISGDWLHTYHSDRTLGAVYLNNKRLKAVLSVEQVQQNELSWYAEVTDAQTIIYANFGKANPKKELVEINVRQACFFPAMTGVNYITVDGLNIAQAAPQWAPPTAPQMGMVGPNWSKGWVIKNCEISHSRTSGISLGKDNASGNNLMSLYDSKKGFVKDGFSREIESILSALNHGWNKDNIGSHLIEHNYIHHCGQTGIVGHLGGISSIIRHNRIDHINVESDDPKGFETGGIKMHAAIDVVIDHNYISNTVRGIWLDWQAQGVHLCNNIIKDSQAHDFFIEVSHGPTLVYNNIFMSNVNIYLDAQGVAVFNNLFNGAIKTRQSQIRYTPYHLPHSTAIKGFYNNPGGDARLYNNIFLCNSKNLKHGLSDYNAFPSYEMTLKERARNTEKCLNYKFPVWAASNVYFVPNANYKYERNFTTFDGEKFEIVLKEHERSLDIEFKADRERLEKVRTKQITTQTLGETMISEAYFEHTDGSFFSLEKDMFGQDRKGNTPLPGPMESFKNTITW